MFEKKNSIILIGSSTGGPGVVETILNGLDPRRHSLLIAQHMPEGYTEKWAERLNSLTPFEVKEGADGMEITAGSVFIAPGGRHLKLDSADRYRIVISDEAPVKRFRPSIEVLFRSALVYPEYQVFPVMLTGMSDDGVDAMLELKQRGFITIAQDRESSAVFGMNREAIVRGAVCHIFSPQQIIQYFNGI